MKKLGYTAPKQFIWDLHKDTSRLQHTINGLVNLLISSTDPEWIGLLMETINYLEKGKPDEQFTRNTSTAAADRLEQYHSLGAD